MGEVGFQARIAELEQAMAEQPQEEIRTRHHFADGIYCREIFIPAGVLLTGKIHKFAHVNIVSQGKIAVASQEGRKIITAPATFVSPPGTKRAGVAIQDTVWTTVHAVGELRDLDNIEATFIAQSFEEYRLFCDEQAKLEQQSWRG